MKNDTGQTARQIDKVTRLDFGSVRRGSTTLSGAGSGVVASQSARSHDAKPQPLEENFSPRFNRTARQIFERQVLTRSKKDGDSAIPTIIQEESPRVGTESPQAPAARRRSRDLTAGAIDDEPKMPTAAESELGGNFVRVDPSQAQKLQKKLRERELALKELMEELKSRESEHAEERARYEALLERVQEEIAREKEAKLAAINDLALLQEQRGREIRERVTREVFAGASMQESRSAPTLVTVGGAITTEEAALLRGEIERLNKEAETRVIARRAPTLHEPERRDQELQETTGVASLGFDPVVPQPKEAVPQPKPVAKAPEPSLADQQRKREDLKRKIAKLTEQVESLTAELSGARSDARSKFEETKLVRGQLEDAKKLKPSLDAKIAELRDAQEKLLKLQEDLERKERERREALDREARLIKKSKDSEDALRAASQKKEELLTAALSKSRAEQQILLSQKSGLEAELAKKIALVTLLEEQQSVNIRQITQLEVQSGFAQERQRAKDLEKDRDRKREEDLKEARRKAEIDRLKAEIDGLKLQISELQTTIDDQDANIKRLNGLLSELQSHLSDSRSRASDLESRASSIIFSQQSQITSLSQQRAKEDLKSENTAVRKIYGTPPGHELYDENHDALLQNLSQAAEIYKANVSSHDNKEYWNSLNKDQQNAVMARFNPNFYNDENTRIYLGETTASIPYQELECRIAIITMLEYITNTTERHSSSSFSTSVIEAASSATSLKRDSDGLESDTIVVRRAPPPKSVMRSLKKPVTQLSSEHSVASAQHM